MRRSGKKAYMSRTVVLVFVIAILGMGGERVCFGLLNENPWPLPTVWWAGAQAGNRTIGWTPATGVPVRCRKPIREAWAISFLSLLIA